MSTELPKTYDPAAVESAAYQMWMDAKCFHPSPSDAGPPYSIVIPPPNVTGALHLGHAINGTLQDILIRMHRMKGFNTLWVPGIDHAGIATQAVVEKQLKEKENKTRHDVGREALVQRIWDWKQQFGDRIINQLKRIGCSCDWDRQHFTLDETCAKAVRETFFKLFKDGLIYRGKRLVNWDVHLQTSISDDEIYHETVKTHLWHIQYEIVDGSGQDKLATENTEDTEKNLNTDLKSSPTSAPSVSSVARPRFVTIATTRPETLLGDTAVAVHSEDARWNWAIGKFVKLPLVDRLIPIIADDILVDPKFGSGVVKVTPAHDPNDYAVWQRHQGKADAIDIINLMNPDGTLNESAGEKYKGLTLNKARHAVVNDLKELGLLVKEEPYETQVGHSDRSKTPIQPYLSDQWFIKMAPLAEPALQVVRDGTIKFFPERHAQQYLSWLGEKRDWPISRQLWWGHRIPVWSSSIGDYAGGNAEDYPAGGPPSKLLASTISLHQHFFDACGVSDDVALAPESDEIQSWISICAKSQRAEDAIQLLNARYGSQAETLGFSNEAVKLADEIHETIEAPYTQNPNVLDTWFSSALWPHSTLGWPEESLDLKKWYPTSVLLTGRDIITLWVARMVMMGIYNMGDSSAASSPSPGTPGEGRGGGRSADNKDPLPNPPPDYRERGPAEALGIPFHHVAINPTILDGKGERMSKSKGNGVDPIDIIETHGADALRFTLTKMATETQDVRMPVKTLPDGRNTSDKFDLGRNFATKLWNASRFAMSNLGMVTTETRRDGGVGGDPSSSGKTAIKESDSGERSGATGAPPCLSVSVVLSLADKWIISRFNRAVDEAERALAVYRFDHYAKTCYDFFWRDFCDWYVEAIKPAMKDPARATQTADVLAAVLDGALRLMHPMIPFITEAIFQQLNEVRPERGIVGLLECPPSPRLIQAKWPAAGPVDDDAEHVFPRMQGIIGAIRNLRNEHKVDPKRPVSVSIVPPGEEAVKATLDNRELIESLATCHIQSVAADLPAPPNSVRAHVDGCDIYVEGLVDENAERERLAKKRDDLARQIAAMKGRLANEAYTSKAPPHLVKQTQDQLAAAEAELAKLG